MKLFRTAIHVCAMLLLGVQAVNAQSDILYDCPFSASFGGDFIDRGFYVDNYPGSTLDTVDLQLQPSAAGNITFTLTAFDSVYDGQLIGTAQVSGFMEAIPNDVTFNFSSATVTPGATVAFRISAVGGSAFYDVGLGSTCTDITQTNGTTPPLDTVRRNTVGLLIRGIPENVVAVPGGITVSPISGNTTEAGGTATFTVVLDSLPTATVSIDLASDNIAEGTVTPATLVFDGTDWDTPQVVTVTGQDDAVVDGDVVFNIVTSPAVSNDNAYAGIDANDVRVINEDDDVAPLVPLAPAVPVPTLSGLGLLLMASLMLLLAFRHKRVR